MQYDDFVGQVQHRARLSDSGEAVHAIRATLEVLGRRLFGGEVKDMGSQLPREIAHYLQPAEQSSETFGLDEFFHRVSEIEGTGLPVAVHHARAVISVLQDVLSRGQVEDIRDQLPPEFDPLFETGSEGTMRTG